PLALSRRAPPGAREHVPDIRRDLREPGRGAEEQPPRRPADAGVPLPPDPPHLPYRGDPGRVREYADGRDGPGQREPDPCGRIRKNNRFSCNDSPDKNYACIPRYRHPRLPGTLPCPGPGAEEPDELVHAEYQREEHGETADQKDPGRRIG